MKGYGRNRKRRTIKTIVSLLLLVCLLFQGVYKGAVPSYALDGEYAEGVLGEESSTANSEAENTVAEEETQTEETQQTQSGKAAEDSEEDSQEQEETQSESDSKTGEDSSDSSEDQDSADTQQLEGEESDPEDNSTSDTTNSSSDALNLANYITGVTAQQLVDGKWTDLTEGASLKNGDSLRIQIDWTIGGSDFETYRNEKFYYQLPDGFALPAAISGNIMYGNSGIAGTFEIDETGYVEISYNASYNTSNLSTDNYMTLVGNAQQYEKGDTNTITFVYKDTETEIEFSNTSDFSIEKKAEKVAQTDGIGEYEYIDYTITISSEYGTAGDITLKDVLQRNQSSKERGITAHEYELDSITVDGVEITDETSSYSLSSVNNKASTASKTFTIENLSKLEAGESHVITYRVKTSLMRTSSSSESNPWITLASGSVDNTATATCGDVSKSATAAVSYGRRLTKNATNYSDTTGRITWAVYAYQDPDNGENLTGYKIVDTLTETAGTATLQIPTQSADGKWSANGFSVAYYTNAAHDWDKAVQLSVNEYIQYLSFNGNTFTFTIPETPEGVAVYGWRIGYYVDTTGDSSSNINISNNAKLSKDTTDSSVWQVTSTKVGTIKATGTPVKEFVEATDVEGSSSLKKLSWNASATYTGATQKSYTVTDNLVAATNVQTSETYTGAHYATVYELLMDLMESLKVDVTIDGTDYTLTYNLATGSVNLQGAEIKIILKDSNGDPLIELSSNNTYTEDEINEYLEQFKKAESESRYNVYSFEITYSRDPQTKEDGTTETQELKSISVSYDTFLDTSQYTSGSVWDVVNQFYAQGTKAQDDYRYSTQTQDLFKAVDVPSKAGGSVNFQFANSSMPYNYVRTDSSTGQQYILYMVVLEVGDTEYDEIVVEDVIPEGTSLTTGGNGRASFSSYEYVWAGPYVDGAVRYASSATSDQSSNLSLGALNWTWNNRVKNISVTEESQESGGTKLTFTLKNINKDGGMYATTTTNAGETVGTGYIGIRYRVYIDDWDKAFSQSVSEDKDGNALVNYSVSNTATWVGHSSYTVDLDVQKEESVLDKTGEQVKTSSGATTSTAHYSIKINEAKVKLLEEGSTAEGVTLVDTITSEDLNFQLDRSSIKLYELDDEGNKAEVEISNIQFSDADDQNQTITIVVKDETAYVLEYDYNVTGTVQNGANKGKLSNTASLNGITKTTEDINVLNLSAAAVSDFGGVTLYKVDSKNQLLYLSGAEFKLEYYDTGSDTFKEVTDFEIQDKNGYVFDYYDANKTLKGNTLYRIVETKAPDQYVLDTTPTYFVIKGNIEAGKANLVIQEDDASLNLAVNNKTSITSENVEVSSLNIQMLSPSSSGTIYISNTKMGSLRIVKQNSKGEVLSGAKFALYKDNDGERGDLVKDNLVSDSKGVIELSALAQGTYHLVETEAPDRYAKEESDIIFRISDEETTLLSSTENVTTDTVTEKLNEGTDEESETTWHVLTVTNQLITYQLPIAGGNGYRVLFLLMLLGAAFACVLVGKRIYRRRLMRH